MNFHSSTIKNIEKDRLTNDKKEFKSHKSCSPAKSKINNHAKLEGLPIYPDSGVKFYKLLNAKETLKRSKTQSKKPYTKPDKQYRPKEERSAVEQVKQILPNTEENNKSLPFSFAYKRRIKKSSPKREESECISNNPFYSENPYKFLPKRFQRNPRFALSFKSKEGDNTAPDSSIPTNEQASPIPNNPPEEMRSKHYILLPELTKAEEFNYSTPLIVDSAEESPLRVPKLVATKEESTGNGKSTLRMINFSNAIELKQERANQKLLNHTSHQFNVKRYYKKTNRVKQSSPELPTNSSQDEKVDHKISEKIRSIMCKRQQSVVNESRRKQKLGEREYSLKSKMNVDLFSFLQPNLQSDDDKKMQKLIDALYRTEVKFKRKSRSNVLTDNELIFDLSKISNLNVRNRKPNEGSSFSPIKKKESASSFLLNALNQ
jgi:hypothetical protein